jgi:hypothetical protein
MEETSPLFSISLKVSISSALCLESTMFTSLAKKKKNGTSFFVITNFYRQFRLGVPESDFDLRLLMNCEHPKLGTMKLQIK